MLCARWLTAQRLAHLLHCMMIEFADLVSTIGQREGSPTPHQMHQRVLIMPQLPNDMLARHGHRVDGRAAIPELAIRVGPGSRPGRGYVARMGKLDANLPAAAFPCFVRGAVTDHCAGTAGAECGYTVKARPYVSYSGEGGVRDHDGVVDQWRISKGDQCGLSNLFSEWRE